MIYSKLFSFFIFISRKSHKHSLVVRGYVRFINIFLPLFFSLEITKPALIKSDLNIKNIVSITSFPARIDRVWLTIESLLHQDKKPDKILLWLYKGEFSSKIKLPKKLLEIEKRGLEIRFCNENLMPHKKYFYTMQEFPESNIITIDDDILYPPFLIETLNKFNKRYPKSILCPITREIKIRSNAVAPYSSWRKLEENSKPRMGLLTMGGGGTLFPPGSLQEPICYNKLLIEKLALKSDDLWLKIMATKKGTSVVSLAGDFHNSFIPIYHKSKEKLMDLNVNEGLNDIVFLGLLQKFQIDVEVFKK